MRGAPGKAAPEVLPQGDYGRMPGLNEIKDAQKSVREEMEEDPYV